MKKALHNITRIAALSLAFIALAGPGNAQKVDFGAAAFMENCAVCHGPMGAGDGPVAELFASTPMNLQLLAENNGGAFPFSEVYVIIAGNRGIR